MTISELIDQLLKIKSNYGDLRCFKCQENLPCLIIGAYVQHIHDDDEFLVIT